MIKKYIFINLPSIFIFCSQLLFSQASKYTNLSNYYEDVFYESISKNSYSINQLRDDTVFSVIGRWPWGSCRAVEIKDSIAYIANGSLVQIIKIEDNHFGDVLAEIQCDHSIYDLELREDILFICYESGILIVNVADSINPDILSNTIVPLPNIKFAIDGNYCYVLNWISQLLQVIDISNLSNPYLRGNIFVNFSGRAASLDARDGFVFLGNLEWPALTIVNATDPDNLSISNFGFDGRPTTVFIRDTLLFAGVQYSESKLEIFSISNNTPFFLGEIETGDSIFIHSIRTSKDNSTAFGLVRFINSESLGILSFDITDPYSPTILGDIKLRQIPSADQLVVSNTNLLAAYNIGAYLFDVLSPDSITTLDFIKTASAVQKVYLKDSLLFAATGYAGLWIIDIKNPYNPIAISNINTGGFTVDLYVQDTLIYLLNKSNVSIDNNRGLWIANIQNIQTPELISHHIGIVKGPQGSYEQNNSITKSQSFVFITQPNNSLNDSTLEIIDVSNPSNPYTRAIYHCSHTPMDVCIMDTILYLATFFGGIELIDISNIENPTLISNILNIAQYVTYQEPYLYVMARNLYIINVDNPLNPSIISTTNTSSTGSRGDFYVNGRYCYWADGLLGIIDVSNPIHPFEISTFITQDWALDIKVNNDIMYCAQNDEGVLILKNNLLTQVGDELNPDTFILFQNYPNPFNPYTNIMYSIEKTSSINLSVFDILGREIRILINEEQLPGSYNVKFDGSNLPSGLYLYKLTGDDFHLAKKMLLIK